MFTELESEAGYISYAVKNEGTDFIDNFNEKGKRITLVSSDGTVLADTSASVEELENHSDRKEIEDAINNWELRNRDGKKQVAKAINRVAPEIFDRTTRIMYKVYEMMNGGGKYDPSADIAFFVSAINFEDVDTFTIMSSEDIPF